MKGAGALGIAATAMLAACSAGSQGGERATTSDAPTEKVACALNGSKDYRSECTVERSKEGGKMLLLLRHPNGGFRRLEEIEPLKRYAALDGADQPEVTPNGADSEVSVGDDHYLFVAPPQPAASVAPSDAARP